jgi:predicted amidohydrolase YtcJ
MTAKKLNTVFLNGKIRPFADTREADALLLENGAIKAIGFEKEVLASCGNNVQKIDLRGKTVLPGFFDSHLHLIETGKVFNETRLENAASIDGLIELGKNYLESNPGPSDKWVFGRGWNQENFREKRYPTRHDLDKICQDRPIMYQRCCGIVAVLNSKGLEMMGIDENFSIHGGLIDKGRDGKPNGIVRREALDGWVKARLPKLDRKTARAILENITAECAARGITSAQSDDLLMYPGPADLEELYRETACDGKLAIRTGQQYQLRNLKAIEEFIGEGHRSGEAVDRDGMFTTGPVKIIIDGSLGSHTAALREEYSDAEGEIGLFVHSDEELLAMMETAHRNNFQMAIHAIGDAALEKTLDNIMKIQSRSESPWKHRIVHCQIGDALLYKKMAEVRVRADVQPAFVASEWSWVPSRVGAVRSSAGYAWKTLLDYGIVLGGSSDSPVEKFDPLWGIQTAVTRTDADGNPPGGWLPEQRLSLSEALFMFTMGSAIVCGEDDIKGSLTPGKYGDFVVLDEDPFCVETDRISKIRPLLTVLGGKPSFRGDGYIEF